MNTMGIPKKIGGSISGTMFGDVYTTFTSIENYIDESFEYRVEGIRWPGGSLAEGKTAGKADYDLLNPDVYAFSSKAHSSKGLEGVLKIASDLNQPFSMVIPTLPTFEAGSNAHPKLQSGYLTQLSENFKNFYNRFTSRDGYWDSAIDLMDNGQIAIFEIGNETAHLGWKYGNYDSDWNYGRIAASLLKAASDLNVAESNLGVEIAVQMGTNIGGAKSIIDEISQYEKTYRADLFGQIDRLVSHNMLVYSAEDFNVEVEAKIIDAWMDAVGRNVPNHEPSLYASAWGVGDHRFGHDIFADHKQFSLFHPSDFSLSSQYYGYYSLLIHLQDNDTGARQGSGTADVFSKMLALGYASAALWGTVDPYHHSNSFQSFWNEHAWNDPSHDKSAPLSHGGEVLAMIAENLIGFSLVSGGSVNIKADGDLSWNAVYFDEEDRSGAGQVNSYHFSDGENVSVLLSVTDIDGWLSTSGGVLDYKLNVPNGADTVTVQAVGTEFKSREWQNFRDNPNNDWLLNSISNTELQAFRRLFEAPVISEHTIDLGNSDAFEYTFTSDFETVLFTFNDYSSALSNEDEVSELISCSAGLPNYQSEQKFSSKAMAAQSSEVFIFSSPEGEEVSLADTLIHDDFRLDISTPKDLANHFSDEQNSEVSSFSLPGTEISVSDFFM